MPSTYDEKQVRWGVGLTCASLVASITSLLLFADAVWTDAGALGLWVAAAVTLGIAGAVAAWFAMDLVWSGREELYAVAVGAFRLACVALGVVLILVALGALYFTSGACCG